MKMTKNQALLIVLLLAITAILYYPGLTGGFIFDDLHSLSKLTLIDNDLSVENVVNYIGAGDTGPLKRPISVMSFLLDGQTWPTGAASFKRTNLIIHLINGFLLFGLLLTLFRNHERYRDQATGIALFATACWLLHPFFVSTTMYIVQRMAMLPTMFVLMGMWLYVCGRLNHHNGLLKKARWQLIAAVFVMVPLAVLSKENGILLIFYIGLIEWFLCRRWLSLAELSNGYKWWLLRLPIVALLAVILIQVPGFIAGYEMREFTLTERLMTQPRAVVKYLSHLLLPHYFTEGVFTDGFKYSTGLTEPMSTLWSILLVMGMALVAFLCRHRFVWLTFALCFYAVAQILESTIVPLELYYEHRNYLAALFIFVPLAIGFWHMTKASQVLVLVPVLVVMFMGFQLHLRAKLWSDNFHMHYLTMEKFPESIRVRTMTAVYLENYGKNEEALQLIQTGVDLHQNLELRFNKLSLMCNMKRLTRSDVNQLTADIESFEFTKHDVRPLGSLVAKLIARDCLAGEAIDAADEILHAIKNNANVIAGFGRPLVLYLEGSILLEQNQFDAAKSKIIESFNETQDDFISINNSVVKFLAKGQIDHADELLLLAEKQYEKVYALKPDWLNHGVNLNNNRVVINQIRKQNSSGSNGVD